MKQLLHAARRAYIAASGIEGVLMNRWIAPLKLFSYVVLALMAVAIVYAAVISVTYWSGISV